MELFRFKNNHNEEQYSPTEINSVLPAENPTEINRDVSTADIEHKSIIKPGTILFSKYRVVEKMDVFSGEAEIFKCEYHGKTFVAKAYRREHAVKDEVLEAIRKIDCKYIAPIFDFGVFCGHTIEIAPYYKNGSLSGKTYSFQDLKKTIIPQVNEALNVLHNLGIVHKDLKPSNLMLQDNGIDIAIIDFGISSIAKDGQTVINTRTGMTPEYSAPETFNYLYLAESDYYSFGITIFELFSGSTPYKNMTNDERARMAILESLSVPQNFPKELRNLITALTYKDITHRNELDNINRRWTYNEVKKWCEGESQLIPGEVIVKEGAIRPYSFNGEKYDNIKSLCEAMASNWNLGKKELFRGRLSGFFMDDEKRESICSRAQDEVENGNASDDFLFFEVIYKLSPNISTFYWKDRKYDDISELGLAIQKNAQNSTPEFNSFFSELCKNGIISEYMKLHNFSEAEVKGMKACEFAIDKNNKDIVKYYSAGYLLTDSDKRIFKLENESFTNTKSFSDYLVMVLTDSVENFNKVCEKLIDKNGTLVPQFEAWLNAVGKGKELEQWKKESNVG